MRTTSGAWLLWSHKILCTIKRHIIQQLTIYVDVFELSVPIFSTIQKAMRAFKSEK
jgi:hypothetical protein